MPLWFSGFHGLTAEIAPGLKAEWGAGEAEVAAALGGKLGQVLLERREPGATPKNLAAIEAAPTADLGKPAVACDKTRGSPRLAERQWRASASAVHLTLMDYTGAAMRYDSNRDITDPRVPSYEYTLYSRRSVPKRIVPRWFAASDKSLEGPSSRG